MAGDWWLGAGACGQWEAGRRGFPGWGVTAGQGGRVAVVTESLYTENKPSAWSPAACWRLRTSQPCPDFAVVFTSRLLTSSLSEHIYVTCKASRLDVEGCCSKENYFLHHSKTSCTGLVGEPWSLMEQKHRFLCEGCGRPPGRLVGMRGQGLR